MKSKQIMVAVAASLTFASNAWATNGYAPHGVGQKSKGMGGVGIALAQDSLVAGMNPAGMVHVGNRLDVGLEWFRPTRDSEIVDNGFFGGPGSKVKFDGNDTENFFIPEFGYNRMIRDDMSLGVSVFGTGGMNTDYKNGIPLFNGGSTNRTGIDLMQLFVVPTLSWQINERHSLGIGINLAMQAFKAKGLQSFAGSFPNPQFSESPDNVTNNGRDYSYGGGLRIGWMGKVTDRVTLGATYQSRTWMSEFDDYKGLFAEQGDFDIPENFGAGISVQATPKLVLAFDIMRINYSKVKSIGNSINKMMSGNALGSNDGPGFGWEDINVYKLGAAYDITPDWTIRAGWNHGDNPIPRGETLFNMLAPGVIEDHLTLGATWTMKNGQELTFTYAHAFEEEVKGSNSIPPNFGGGNANIKMYQNSFGIAWAMPL